ncbi:sigma-54-dependent Fis family transcriptional regulator [Lamprobacter modestohalophilus]|uniref:Sigma-54-dependent Fis family transcriptional regulator n=1 Tax=Lamprobacter modestohalophilus TaxID=1064514 RepID=A0A9X0W677_9GAMM|nr:sigma-54 dependent transcriptional regulator [Lamprobacter modestohalophilus]MBK1617556.1 sigma-54-dependent Fis family transcriptional regulator [Lamprobacter modestohalophilus]
MSKAHLLIVDDEPDILELVTITCARMGVGTQRAQTLAEAYHHLEQETFDLCLTDMRLPDGNGIDLVRLIAKQYPNLPVAMLTAYGSMDSAVAAMKAGAFDFVSKPVDLQVLRNLIGAALKLSAPPSSSATPEQPSQALIGDSLPIRETRALIAKLARNQAPVFITGESGTGKELAARLIHLQGPRREHPFVPVNCGAIPADLMESELFGHRKGSFTGAVCDKAGLFQATQGGTLFLDEIADLPLPMQVKLLRAIQQKSVRPVGSETEVEVDVRIISASHRNLDDEVERGNFRRDLYYRIDVIELLMPALRSRPEDIPPLADHILGQIAEASGTPKRYLSDAALCRLAAHPFPGNVRELQNLLERATALTDDVELGPEDLYLPANRPLPARAKPVQAEEIDRQPLGDQLDEIERRAILEALDATHWNRTAAAKQLGMTTRSLRYRLSKLGLS